MKFRTDFVTNSSSTGYIIVWFFSETLYEVMKECGYDESLFEKLNPSDIQSGMEEFITSSPSDSLINILEYHEEYEDLVDKIKANKDQIDHEAWAFIDSSTSINEGCNLDNPGIGGAMLYVNKGNGAYKSFEIGTNNADS